MSGESNMWRAIRPAMKKAGLDPVRIEGAAAGTPDVNYTLGWIELKYVKEWPKRKTTTLKIAHYTAHQRVWLERRGAHAYHTYILLKVGKAEWLLLKSTAFGPLYRGELTREALGEAAQAHWEFGLDRDDLMWELGVHF